MGRKKPTEPASGAPTATAEQLQQTVQAAKTLAAIPDQELLENPALNPATRARYDELTAARLQEELDLQHRRKLRRTQELDRREGESARVAAAIAAARQATDPSRTVMDMSRHQRVFGHLTLAASIALSVGSAMGMEAMVEAAEGPAGVGYLAEIGLTGLSTTVIIWRGLLARAGTVLSPWSRRLFAVLIVLPLLVSIVGSTLGSGPIGAACSVGSALFAGLAYLISTTASEAIGQAVERIDEIEDARRAPSTTPAAAPGGDRPGPAARGGHPPAQAAGIGDQATAWLAEITRADDLRRQGVDGESATPDGLDRHPLAEGVATPDYLGLFPELEGTRLEIMLAIHAYGVATSNRALAKLVRCSRDTIRTHRTALGRDGYEVFDPTKNTDS